MTLFRLFELFTAPLLTQLLSLSPLIILSLLLLAFSLWRLHRLKVSRPLPGFMILATLAAYFVFVLLMLGLSPTGTSYGNPVPVLLVLGVFYLFSLGLGLLGLLVWCRWARLRKFGRLTTFFYALAHLILLGVLFYGFYIEPDWVEVTNTEIRQAKLAPGTPPIRIALISDIHMERWTRREDDVLA